MDTIEIKHVRVKLSNEESRIRRCQAVYKCIKNRLLIDEEFKLYKNKLTRIRNKTRYDNDPEYRAQKQEQNREYQRKRHAQLSLSA
jgi:hypothetical protein